MRLLPFLKTALFVLSFCAFAFFSIHLKSQLRRAEAPEIAVKLREPLPDFTLDDATGKSVRFSSLTAGKKVVALNFWASWCGPCRMEMPEFEQVYRNKKDAGFLLVGVSEDENHAKMQAYLQGKPVSFPILRDGDGKLAKRFGIKALPTTILIGPDGRVERVMEGVQPYFEYQLARLLHDEKKK